MKQASAEKLRPPNSEPRISEMTPEVCPHCGAEVPAGAKACPECGSDETTGWSERACADNLGLPDEEFDYEEFVKEEFGAGRAKPHSIRWFWWVVALLLVLLLAFLFLR
jgi:ribosomal protein L40E